MADGAHDHPLLAPLAALTAETSARQQVDAALQKAIDDLTARVVKLEAPVVIPPQPPPGQVPSGPITLSPTNKLVENVIIDLKPGGTITAADQLNSGNRIYGRGLTGVVIRNVTIRGAYFGIQLVDCDGYTIENVTITDAEYSGISIFGGKNGKILNPNIQRIGTLRLNGNQRPDGVAHPQGNNAYGIIFSTSAPEHGITGGTGLQPTDCLVSGGTVTDSPLWMCVNAHEATRLTVENMILRRAPRAIFMAGPITDAIVRNNDIREPVTKAGGSTDIESVLYSGWTRGSIIGNKIGAGYPMPAAYGSNPTPPTVSANVRV